ncbi:polycystin cation channel protein [Cystoisospora suis]|uniref:Polycystin cation channel protein n=1 Tax=Cystoisospora suis TaxID=483139 RepID=A0A2C6KT12_9APIC|nr:polycystin cation channel protein [Cystoisospora suis]
MTNLIGQPYIPFVVNNWNVILLPYPVRLRLTLSEASKYPLDLKFLQASTDSFLIYDHYLSAAWDFKTLLEKLQTLSREKILRDISSSLEIRFLLYNNFSQRNQLALCYIKFQRTPPRGRGQGDGILHLSYNVPSLTISPYDTAHTSSVVPTIAFQVIALCMLVFLILSGVVSLVAYFKEPLPPHTEFHGFGFRLVSYFFDDLFNLLDLSLFLIFTISVFLWLAFSLNSIHSIHFLPSDTGFSLDSSSSSSSRASPRSLSTHQEDFEISSSSSSFSSLGASLRHLFPLENLGEVPYPSMRAERSNRTASGGTSFLDTTTLPIPSGSYEEEDPSLLYRRTRRRDVFDDQQAQYSFIVDNSLLSGEEERSNMRREGEIKDMKGRFFSSIDDSLPPGVTASSSHIEDHEASLSPTSITEGPPPNRHPSHTAFHSLMLDNFGEEKDRRSIKRDERRNRKDRRRVGRSLASSDAPPQSGDTTTPTTPGGGENGTEGGEGGEKEESEEERKKIYSEMNALFSSFDQAYSLLDVYFQLVGAVIALSFLRTLRLFEKRKRMIILFFTVSETAENLLFVFFSVFFLYAGLVFACYLSFGFRISDYSSLRASFVSSFLMLLGCFSISDLFSANKPVAGIVIFPYLFIVGVVSFGCFLAVLLRSFVTRLGEVETAEALLNARGDNPPRSLSESFRLFLDELLCRSSTPSPSSPPPTGGGDQGREGEQGGGEYDNTNKYDAESVDEFEIMKDIDEQARKRRNKPLKVAELPKEVFTTQLTDEQWSKLAPRVREWAVYEVGEFIDVFRKLETQSNLAGTKKLPFIQQTEKAFYEKVISLDKETQQQESHLSHRLAVYKNQVLVEQEKIANYTRYLEQALDDRQRELEMLRREFDLLQTKAEELKEEEERRRAAKRRNRHGHREDEYD